MGRAFEYRKATKLKRWGHMAKTFTRLGKQIAIAVKAGGPEPENNPTLRGVIATCTRHSTSACLRMLRASARRPPPTRCAVSTLKPIAAA